jgi:hypothetical protein
MGDFVVNCYTRQDLSHPAPWNHGDARRLVINMKSFVRGAAAAISILLVAGCGPGKTHSAPTSAPRSSVTEEHEARLPVPAGYALQGFEFADATHGYAQYTSRDPVKGGSVPEFASVLFATTDGGRVWTKLADPRRPSNSPQLYTVDATTVVLWAEPYGWYVSRDGGATFTARSDDKSPPELNLHDPRFHLYCEFGCVIKDSQTSKKVADPGVPGVLTAVAQAGSTLIAASADGNRAYTAFSTDNGATWQRRDVPDHPGGRPMRSELRVSADGKDVWLIGYPGTGAGGAGALAPRRLKELGVPLLWLLDGQAWVAKGTVGAPAPTPEPFSVAAIGGGLAAVQGHGLALVDDAWHPVAMSPPAEWVTSLPDGTVAVYAPTAATAYLGQRSGTDVRWTKIVLSAA